MAHRDNLPPLQELITMTAKRFQPARIFAAAAFVAVAGVAIPAFAGELKFGEGADSLKTDDNGKLTAEGAKTAIKELDKVPGEDEWDLKIWAKIDRGGEGPLYVEFFREGEKEPFWRYEDPNYDGGKYWSQSVLLEGAKQFNKNQSYIVRLSQANAEGKDIKLAEGTLKLINTGRVPEKKAGEDEDEDEDEDENEDEDEDDKPAKVQKPTTAEPPETEDPGKKRGCTVTEGPADPLALGLGLVVLLGIGAGRRRRQQAA